MTTTIQNRRYYLHQRIKDNFRYSARKKTVYLPWEAPPPPLPEDRYLRELSNKHGYSLQLEIT